MNDRRTERQTERRSQGLTRRQRSIVLLAAAASSACGLATELLLGGLTSYLIGDHALAYGVAVGGFLAAMGVGSYLSQFVAIAADGDADGDQANPLEYQKALVQAFI
ncbi:MAG: spermidine synthase, partial [Cyanobacteria bacterium P01_H01_bin.130]